MRTSLIALALGLVGCSAAEQGDGDNPPPTLEITSPARGTMSDAGSIRVTGVVTDDGPVQVTVNGQAVSPAADGSFEATVALTEGIALVETHAIDTAGNDVRDVRAVLVGALAPSDGTLAAPIAARAGTSAIGAVATALGTAANAIDFNAVVKAMNPVFSDTGCLGAVVNVTNVSLGNIGVGLTPGAGKLGTAVTINNVVVTANANFRVACVGGSTTVTLRATRARINGDLGVRVAAGKLATSLPSPTIALDGFSFDIGGVPGALESLFRNQVRNAVENALANAIRDRVPPLADQALAGLLAKPFALDVLGRPTRLTVAPAAVDLSAAGLFVAVDTKVLVEGGEGGTFVTAPASASPGMMDSGNLGVALADDLVNQLFAGLWAAGALDMQLGIDAVGPLAVILDDDVATLDIKLALPPTVSTSTGDLALAVGDLLVIGRDSSGTEVQSVALSLRTSLSAAPTSGNTIALAVGTPTIKAQVLVQTEVVDFPLTDDKVEGLVTGVWGAIGGLADEALANLPLPSLAGVQLGAPTIAGRDHFVLADVPLQ